MADERSTSVTEETDTKQKLLVDPPVRSHRPSSAKSQDISHVLASIFTDTYAAGIIGKDDFHVRYVEELQQAHAEYEKCVKEADMLEAHIIQARARAKAKESHAYERMKEDIETLSDYQDLFQTKPALPWCLDQDLLRRHDLIAPQDYLPVQKPQLRAPPAVTSNPAKAYNNHVRHASWKPQDGYTPIPKKKTVLEMKELEHSVTFECSSDCQMGKRQLTKEKPNQIKHRPKWKDEPSAKDRAEGLKTLQKLKDRHSFLRNPRFLPPSAKQGGSLIRSKANTEHEKGIFTHQSPADDPVPVFLATPPAVIFTEYSMGCFYEATLELRNVTSSGRHVRVIPPTTPYFSIGLGRFPSEGSIVAPGMSCKYIIRFAPDSLVDYEDFIVVEAQTEQLFVVPIEARRPPPVLTLPPVLNCGYCLVGGVKFVEFPCQNVGLSTGMFCIIPKNQWPPSNIRSAAWTHFSEEPPFALGPSLFVLQPGESTVVEVVFFPSTAERSCQVFTVVCDNCQVKDLSIKGEGQRIALELVSVSGQVEPPVVGEVRDLTAEHFVRFSSSNPHSVQQKRIVIRNNVHLELPFHWQVMKPNLHPPLPGKPPDSSHIRFHLATDEVFHISPSAGFLKPFQDQEFHLTFCPKELKDYHSVCHLVLRDVPQLPPEPSESSVLHPVHTSSKLGNVTIMEIEMKGSTEPYQILLEPHAVIIPGEVFMFKTTHRQFKMWNHSKTFILFQWERLNSSSHIIEVEPSAGRIEENECFDFDLIVTGGKPEKLVTSLVCNIQHHHEPVTLNIEVSFKGPTVTLNVPSVDFGLMRLGEQAQTTLLLTNNTQLEASWSLVEKFNGPHKTQISVEPSRGVLPPLASCDVLVLFRPHFRQQFETELELAVENGTGCHIWMQADVQSPQVCLLNCKLVFSELYIGIPNRGSVTLFNQTLLPSHFSWMAKLQGKQASLCAASFDPSSGVLGPNTSLEITVHFTSNTDLELTEVAALCEIQGMKSPLALCIVAPQPKKLRVSYSLPSICPPGDDGPLVLDFGGDVILMKPVKKQLLITNQSAIPAPFTIEVEYFTCQTLKPDNQSESRFRYFKSPFYSAQAKKIEARAHQDFVSSLLADGRGAAFLVLPDSGLLGAFETQTVDVTAYTDMWGDYRDNLICKVGELEPVLIPMQMSVKGCPLYFQMTGPRQDDQHLGPTIHFGTHISGGDTISRSLRINNPTTFDIRVDWETYNVYHNDRKLVDVVVAYGEAFPLKDADGNEVPSGAFRLSDRNAQTSIKETPTPDSSLQSVTNVEEEHVLHQDDGKREEEICLYPSPPKQKLFSVHIRPHLGNLSDYPYRITPQQTVIPAKSNETIHVSFTPVTLSGSVCGSKCVALALGFMSLDSKMAACVPGKVGRAQGLDLEPVRVDLIAAVKPAVLLVQMEDDGRVLEFNASAGDLLMAGSDKLVVRELDVTQTFELKNTLAMPLHFRLWTRPPFSVLKPQTRAETSSSSNPSTGDGQALVLQPKHRMQVKVAFHCSASLLDHVDEAEEEAPHGAMLIHSESGQRKLRFQQNLFIHHSNNSLQKVPLCAHLALPTLTLSTDCLNFGFCYVGERQTIEVNLCGHGGHIYWKSLTKSNEGDSEVFTVTPDFGLLRSKNLHMTKNQQGLQISFVPREDREFRAEVVIQSPVVKTPLTLQLQGTGSLDDVYKST